MTRSASSSWSSPQTSAPGDRPRATLLAFCALCAVLGLSGCNRTARPAQVGEHAPAVVIHEGTQTVSLAAYQGKIVVLNFWASWCGPCIEEFPSLIDLQRRMPNVVVLAVAFDSDEPSYRQFLVDNNISGVITIDDLSGQSNHAFDTTRPPETYVIDRSGVIRRKFIGMPQEGWTNPEIMNYLKNL